MRLKILSWNIWVDCDFPTVQQFIQSADADIVGLQEVKENDPDRDAVGFMQSLGYESVFAPEQVWRGGEFRFGPALFSRHPMKSTRVHALSDVHRRIAVDATISVDGTDLDVFSTHLMHVHHQVSDETQNAQADALLGIMPHERAIVMGDFNALPESTLIQTVSRTLTNADPSNIPTWSQYPAGCSVCSPQSLTIRYDYIFATPDVTVVSAAVEQSTASDHLPISALIEL